MPGERAMHPMPRFTSPDATAPRGRARPQDTVRRAPWKLFPSPVPMKPADEALRGTSAVPRPSNPGPGPLRGSKDGPGPDRAREGGGRHPGCAAPVGDANPGAGQARGVQPGHQRLFARRGRSASSRSGLENLTYHADQPAVPPAD
jgi:hypothetical protein